VKITAPYWTWNRLRGGDGDFNIGETAEKGPPGCLMNLEEILAWKSQKECKRRNKIEALEHVM
jgi:hypothetical protein